MSVAASAVTGPTLRLAYAAGGIVCLLAGIVGLVLPMMPGTVFLLLAAAAFARSVPAWHQWLTQHRWLGPPIARWQRERCMDVLTKRIALVMLVPPALSTLYVLRDSLWLAALFGMVFLALATYLHTRASCPPAPEADRRASH